MATQTNSSVSNDILTSFVNVENFLRAYSPDETEAATIYGFTTIDRFIEKNFVMLLDAQKFNTMGDSKTMQDNSDKLTLRDTVYKTTKENRSTSSHISKLFHLNYEETLRVLSQMTDSWNMDNKATLETLTECVLKERNSAINVISLLFNNTSFPVVEGKYHEKLSIENTKFDVIRSLIKTVGFVLENFNVNDNDNVDLEAYEMSKEEYQNTIRMKNSYDLIYLTNILKQLSSMLLNALAPVDILSSWFKTSTQLSAFLQSNIGTIITNIPMNIITKIESLVTIDSLLVLGLDTTISALNIESPYFNDPLMFLEIQSYVDLMSNDPILSYMWSFVLYTKSFMIQENPTENVSFLKTFDEKSVIKLPLEELSMLYAHNAELNGVFDRIITVTESLNPDVLYPTIMTSFLTFQLNFIPITTEVSKVIKRVLLNTPTDFVEKFLTSDIFEQKLSGILAKLPLVDDALAPLINICTTNVEFANFTLHKLNTYTTRINIGTIDYDIVEEDANTSDNSKLEIMSNSPGTTDLIKLRTALMLRPPLESQGNVQLSIPKDTKAKIIQQSSNSTDESLLMLLYDYNGWSTVGYTFQNLFEHYIDGHNEISAENLSLIKSIIELISSVVSSNVPIETSSQILVELSSSIDEDSVVLIVFKLLEAALKNRDYDMAVVCSEFTNALVSNFPHFVWSYLARSDLLGKHGRTGLASTILGVLELSSGSYQFTISLCKLANLLVEESLLLGTNMPTKTREEILNKLITHLLNIYESYRFWKFENIYERFELGSQLTTLFTNILTNIYGIDPQVSTDKKVTHMLAKSGKLLIDSFLGVQISESSSASSLVRILTSYTDKQVYALGNLVFGPVYNDLVLTSFSLTTLLVAVRNHLNMKPSALEQIIYTNSPALVDIFCLSRSLKRPIINLLNTLVSVRWSDDNPFLLSFLGEQHSIILVNVIETDLESPLDDFRLSNDIYNFLGTLLESRQDGLATLFLTGGIATSKTIDNKDDNKNHGKSILTILQRNALKLDQLPDYVACALLDAIAYAFNTWVYNKNIKDDTKFIETLMDIFKKFKPEVKSVEDLSYDEVLELSNKFRLVSRILEIFALYIYSTKGTTASILQTLDAVNLADIIRPYFEINGKYIGVLEDVDVRFNKMFPKLSLSKFRLTPGIAAESPNDMFNLELISTLFIGNTNPVTISEQNTLIDDIKNSSLKLQFMNHQVAAAKAWGALLTSFIKVTSIPLKDTFIDIVCDFLQGNIDNKNEGEVLAQIFQERMELCFYILFSFHKTKKAVPEKKLIQILSQFIVIFKSNTVNYLKNVASSCNRELYRPILRSVLIILDLVKENDEFVRVASDSILEFFDWSFSKGVYLILSNILADISPASINAPSASTIMDVDNKIQDVFLLLSLFNKIKQLNPPSSFKIILASSLNDVGTIKVILNLYSSFPTTKLNDEPLLGNLILTLVSELCSVKEISEQFITNGLFAVLLESSISVALQAGSVRLETQPRLHNIWTNGLLSIMLQLLSEFGSNILPESCLFASYFQKQIQSTINNWSDNSLMVSTALIGETTQLIMLQKMLEKLNYQRYLQSSNRAASRESNDNNIVQLIAGLDSLSERKSLNLTLNKLLTHPKYLNSRIIASTLEEQAMLDDDSRRAEFVSHINAGIKELQSALFENL
ncbi:Nup188 protein [Maudiozyma humilis]|uniref:Nucleoporin NUP188 n=1 Tax=Maudiozyma humilis TaxID=51915 RepID=A0AAV5S535_MAUHU|nr:Nup188 protein [Kazachstania humilis]